MLCILNPKVYCYRTPIFLLFEVYKMYTIYANYKRNKDFQIEVILSLKRQYLI